MNRDSITDGYEAYYLGVVSKFSILPNSRKSNEAQLVEKIEQLQVEGRLLLRPASEEAVLIRLDKHGFQVSRSGTQDIVLRVPLHTLAQLVMYEDGFNKYNLTVKVIVGRDLFSCHVFQCHSEESAASICQTLQLVFKAILSDSSHDM